MNGGSLVFLSPSRHGRFSKKWYPKQTSFEYRIFINCSNLRKVIHTKLDFHWAQIAFNFLEENYAICSHPPSQIYVVWMKLPCRGKYFFRNLWSSRIALRFTVSEWIQSRDWLSSSPGSCGLGKGEGASGTIRMFAAALIPTLEHGFSVAWFQIETKFYFGNHWMENRDFHVTIVQWKYTVREKGPIKKALSADFNPDTFILTEKNGEPLHETTFLNLDYNNLFSQTLKRTHPIAMHSTSPENEENILFWQWIVRTKILFTDEKESWSKTVWQIPSVKICEHLLNTIFSPCEWIFPGSSWWGYPSPSGRNLPNSFCTVAYTSTLLLFGSSFALGLQFGSKGAFNVRIKNLNTDFGVSPLTHFFHIFAWTCGAYVLPSVVIYIFSVTSWIHERPGFHLVQVELRTLRASATPRTGNTLEPPPTCWERAAMIQN